MHILVPIKVVPDYKLRLQLNNTNTGVDLNGVKMIINPFDAIALQEAMNIKKQHPNSTITAVFIAPKKQQNIVRESLALGADQAIHIITDKQYSSLNIAKILQKTILDKGPFDLVLMGKQAIDSDANQTPQMLAALLNWPNVCFISDLQIDIKNKQFKATCEWDEGLVHAESTLPAVISCDLRLNTPSPANMMAIMKAKQKPITEINDSDLGLNLKSSQQLTYLEKPVNKRTSTKVTSVDELAAIIKNIKDTL